MILAAASLFERAAVIGAVALLWMAAAYGTDRILHWLLYYKHLRSERRRRTTAPSAAERRPD